MGYIVPVTCAQIIQQNQYESKKMLASGMSLQAL